MKTLLVLFAVLAVAGLLIRSLGAQQRRSQERKAALDRLGLRPCPEERERLQQIVTRLENNHGFRYEVRDPHRTPGEPAFYHYTKVRTRHDESFAEEEVLFRRKWSSPPGLLVIKPSSVPAGLASRLLGSLATGAWDAQPDDLKRVELPRELRSTSIVGALGPAGASFHDLVGADLLSVTQGIGDAGGLIVRFREEWCSVAATGHEIPFRVDQIVTRLQPLV